MNENLNLCEILKGCEDVVLYTTTFGNAIVENFYEGNTFDIKVYDHDESPTHFSITSKGTLVGFDGECIIFPSKDQRDWSKFVKPIKQGTQMMCSDDKELWALKRYKEYKHNIHYVFGVYNKYNELKYKYLIPFKDFNPDDIEGSLKFNIQK